MAESQYARASAPDEAATEPVLPPQPIAKRVRRSEKTVYGAADIGRARDVTYPRGQFKIFYTLSADTGEVTEARLSPADIATDEQPGVYVRIWGRTAELFVDRELELPANRAPQRLDARTNAALAELLAKAREKLISKPTSSVPPALDAQRLMARERLQQLAEEFGLLSSPDLDARRREAAGVADLPSNPSATPTRWEREGKIFALRQDGRNLYPTFQFDARWTPRPVIGDTLKALGAGWDRESVALWFTARNGWLDGRRPVDALSDEPDLVITAATHAVDRDSAT